MSIQSPFFYWQIFSSPFLQIEPHSRFHILQLLLIPLIILKLRIRNYQLVRRSDCSTIKTGYKINILESSTEIRKVSSCLPVKHLREKERERERGNDKGAIIGCLKTYLYPARDKDNLEKPCSWRGHDRRSRSQPRNYRIIDRGGESKSSGFRVFPPDPSFFFSFFLLFPRAIRKVAKRNRLYTNG